MNRILLLFPDGVGIRNYLYSDVVQHLKNEAVLVIWSPLPESAFDEVKVLHNLNFEFKQIDLLPENLWTRLYRESATFARLVLSSKKTNNATILTNWNYHPKSLKLKFLNKISIYLGSWASKSYDRILKLESKAQNNWNQSVLDKYKKDLAVLNLSSIFIAHQRVAGLMPICIAAKQLNIPVVTAIYSWDNLPKARLAVQAHKYIVWSDYMKEEMHFYYPEIPKAAVIVTGTPQFEFYFKQALLETRTAFASKYGLDARKQWICFSGDDKVTSPNDPLYLKDVMDALLSENKLNEIQLIFRRCPADFSNRYDSILSEYKNIVSIDPLWHTTQTGWNFFFPKYEDVKLLVNLAQHCDLVINVASTMAHDFAVFNKPCLYLNYKHKENSHWSSEIVYQFQHFRTMQGLDAVGWLNNAEEIADKIHLALTHPEQVGKDRKKWLEKIVQHPLEENSRKIAHVLLNPN